MKKELLIINSEQFGYHIDTYYYCKYLRNDFSITYISWDHQLPEVLLSGINILYVHRGGNFITRSIRFIKIVLREVKKLGRVLIFIKYFKVVSLSLRLLLPKHKMVLDIRTGTIDKSHFKRKIYDYLIKFESIFFRNITIISESLATKLALKNKAHILPLGSDIISRDEKTYENLNLLYVGTFYMRNIDETIKGFHRFYQEFKDKIKIRYSIVGGGRGDDEMKLRELVDGFGLDNVIKIVGQVPHDKIKSFFDDHNVGVSYIPKTDFFDVQPSTKTFEYLLSGMAVIATSTTENRRIINQTNGVLIDDNEFGFLKGLKDLCQKQFDSKFIRSSCEDYTWEKIVTNNLRRYFDELNKNCFQ